MELRIKEIMKEKGVTQKDIAEKLGIAPATLSMTLNGNPTINTLERIANVLGVGVSELFSKREEKLDPPYTVATCPNCGKQIKLKAE